ncbi:MAG: hypothetical protein LBG58_06025 [Planctomycetaceae bacterium]|nr:hypothetical protein [Planctomycetaceae bacterium]
MAINKAAEMEGCIIGCKCFDGTPIELHKVCKSNVALKERKGVYEIIAEQSRMAFWIPVEGCDDVYVHFSIRSDVFSPVHSATDLLKVKD